MLLLNVPYREKDEAKKLGAKWNPEQKKWYVQEKTDYHKFAKWISRQGDIVACDAIYLLEGKQNCFKCGKETRVIGFGLENYYDFGDVFDDEFDDEFDYDLDIPYYSDVIRIAGPINPIPQHILTYLQSKYNYKRRYSYTTKETHICNCCESCDVLQGDYYLFDEVDSPFFIDSIEKIEKLKIYKIPLEQDIIISASVWYSDTDEMIKEYGKIDLLEI